MIMNNTEMYVDMNDCVAIVLETYPVIWWNLISVSVMITIKSKATALLLVNLLIGFIVHLFSI